MIELAWKSISLIVQGVPNDWTRDPRTKIGRFQTVGMKKSGPTRIGIKYIKKKQDRNKMTVKDWTRTEYFQKLSNRLGPESKIFRIVGPTSTKNLVQSSGSKFSSKFLRHAPRLEIKSLYRRSVPLLYDMTHIVWLIDDDWSNDLNASIKPHWVYNRVSSIFIKYCKCILIRMYCMQVYF